MRIHTFGKAYNLFAFNGGAQSHCVCGYLPVETAMPISEVEFVKSFTPFAGGGGIGALIEADARQCQSSSFLAETGALFSPFKLEMPSIQYLRYRRHKQEIKSEACWKINKMQRAPPRKWS